MRRWQDSHRLLHAAGRDASWPLRISLWLPRFLRFLCSLSLVVWSTMPRPAAAQTTELEFFEKRIRPILVEHCHRCHAADAQKIRGGLLLDTREGIRQGGDSGPAVTPGLPEESLLLEALRHETFEMPPEGRLPDAVIEDFEKWIAAGAVDPRDGPAVKFDALDEDPSGDAVAAQIEAGRDFWAFRVPQATPPPTVRDDSWPLSRIDRYILAGLESNGLEPAPDADRGVLLRRVYFHLTGLPPSPAAIEQFQCDSAPLERALADVVDRLLESQAFGQRWGRHWLDVARFAESSGGGRTLLFPTAWRYRDYVVDALNDDVPYDQFIREQIAGDLIPGGDWREQRRRITATAFLVLGPTNYELQDKDVLEMDVVDEQLDTLGKAFLGMTLGCARCHDHKFDPIPTRDYYALAGILQSTQSVVHANVSAWHTCELPVSPAEETFIVRHEARLSALEEDLAAVKKERRVAAGDAPYGDESIDPRALPGVVVDDAQAEKHGQWTNSTAVGGYVGDGYLHDRDGRGREQHVVYTPDLPRDGAYEVRITYTRGQNRSTRVPWRVRHALGETLVEVDQSQKGSIEDNVETLGVFEFVSDQPHDVVVSNQGVDDGVVIADAVFFIPQDVELDGDAQEQARREKARRLSALDDRLAALEKQIKELRSAGPSRPVAMAVGEKENVGDISLAIRGVVHNPGPIVPRGVLSVVADVQSLPIPDDQSGRRELAAWIADANNPLTARVLVNRIWYWLFGRGLVRTVDNFGVTGDAPSHPELLDHLAVEFVEDGWSIKRLIRRIVLSRVYRMSTLDDQLAASVDPENRLLWRMNRQRLDAESIRDALLFVSGNLDASLGGPNIKPGTKIEYGYQFDSPRRAVYLPVFRNTLPDIFATFDFADPNIPSGQRTSSTIAPQALLLMNHPFVVEQSVAAAERLLAGPEASSARRIRRAYLEVLGREPASSEAALAERFVGDGASAERWGLLYQTLFQSLDFRYLN